MAESADPEQVLALDAAVTCAEAVESDAAAVVRLRFAALVIVILTADTLSRSIATVRRKWTPAWAWPYRERSAGPATAN